MREFLVLGASLGGAFAFIYAPYQMIVESRSQVPAQPVDYVKIGWALLVVVVAMGMLIVSRHV